MVAFLVEKSNAAIEDLVHRPAASTFDSNIGMQYGYSTVPHLARVDITGPYNATGPRDTPSSKQRIPLFVIRVHKRTRFPAPGKSLSNMVRRAFRRVLPQSRTSSLCSSFYQQERTRTGNF